MMQKFYAWILPIDMRECKLNYVHWPAYNKYRAVLEQIHPGSPEWWKDPKIDGVYIVDKATGGKLIYSSALEDVEEERKKFEDMNYGKR